MEHHFDIADAEKYGVNEAIMICSFRFWIKKNQANKKHYHEDRTWTYNSVRAFTKLFPYWTPKQIRTVLTSLMKQNVLMKGNYSKKKSNQTTWYAFKDEKSFITKQNSICPNGQMDVPKRANGVAQMGKSIPIPIPVNNTVKNKGVEISAQKRLELDLLISEQKKFFMEQIAIIFHPNKRELITFVRVTKYLITQCQTGRLQISVFKDAIEWARQAKASNATNKKGLWVAKVKEQTGFKAQQQILQKP